MTRHFRPTYVIATFIACSLLCSPGAQAQEAALPGSQVSAPDNGAKGLKLPSDSTVGAATVLPSESFLTRTTINGRSPNVWRDLFGDTVGDIRNLPSRQTAGWLAVGAAAALGAKPADSTFGRSLSTAKQLEEPLEPGAFVGSTPFQLGLSAATYAFGRMSDSPRMTAVGADLFRAQLMSQGLTMVAKQAVRRHRPEGSGYAFPSGHTTVSFASATVLQRHFGWRVGAPAYAIASYVAMSRVQMQRHYLSDVAFGAALGIAAGHSIRLGQQRQMELAPMFAPGGGGIQFNWVGKR